MGPLLFDLRDALRSFRRDRAYAVTVVLTLALTIGAATAVFSIVNGVLLEPLPFPEPGRLVALREVWREMADRAPTLEVNERHFEHWRAHARSFDAMAQHMTRPANLAGRDGASQVSVVYASGSLFEVLDVPVAIGRALTPDDDPEGAPDVAALSDGLWRQRFGADPSVVGTPIVLDGKPYTVVGILPPGFRLPREEQLTAAADVFVPLRVTVGWVGDHNNEAVGRLRAGVTLDQARAELDALQAQVGEIATKAAHEPVTLASVVRPLSEHVVGPSRRGLLVLLAAVLSVLLIACFNLANLSLTRTLGRLRDTAVRSALGASRARLVGTAFIEQVLLAVAGGALGVWVAWTALTLFVRTAPVDLPRLDDVAIDARVVAFTAGVSALAGLLVALVPAARLAGRDAQSALRVGALAVASDRRGLRGHAALLAAQVALSVTLLVVTALFVTSLGRVLNADRGFSAERVLVLDVALPATRYADEPGRQAAYDRMLAAARALPGVDAAATTSMLPLRGEGQVNFVAREGAVLSAAELPSANFRFVAPEYFQTMGMAVRRGRPFTDAERDPKRPAPALVSEFTAARLWPGDDALGRRFSRGISGEQGFEVVGVVAEARTTALDRAEQPLMVYVPYWWRSRPSTSLLVKTAVAPLSVLPALRRALLDIDPEIAIGRARPMQQIVDDSVAGRRYQAQMLAIFGGVALVIAIIGIYAVASYGISRRRREMNIRVALGAEAWQVVGLVLRQGTTPVLAGAAAGIAGALAMGRVVASLLFEVRAWEPSIIAAVVAVVATVGVATCGLAARRGLRLNPAAALREE
ncbi:MAG: ABC transporter permease [Acidobacteria bacterium]|nr:ABC transporter permease [Acidobacteriota bacterium]